MNLKAQKLGGRLVLGQSKTHAKGDRPFNKYRAIKTTVDGIKFDSRREAERYSALKYLEKAGEIKDLKCQVKFLLIPSQMICGQKVKEITYRADFTYYEDEQFRVEDCKGFRTKEYVIKRKLMKFIHNIEVWES